MANIFQDILLKGIRAGQMPERTEESRTWYKDKASRIDRTRVKEERLFKESVSLVNSVKPGKMYMFSYDPKTKEKMPYYDVFPVIFMVGPAERGFFGINLHYIPPALRLNLMSALYDTANNNKFDDRTKLVISYQLLNNSAKFKAFEPAFKHYLTQHVKSRFIEVHASEWTIAAFLPTDKFRKAGRSKVYSDSRKRIGA
jgi:hypothetical protein